MAEGLSALTRDRGGEAIRRRGVPAPEQRLSAMQTAYRGKPPVEAQIEGARSAASLEIMRK